MTTRSEREKAQKLNEQHQLILSRMLREEDNKCCADCKAKGPRWASWNLGVFMCIRCAGIHRNLGVHIARVKSVNLDQWTPEQIQSMLDMGNRRARLLYEAHLSENFRRPQTDQALEVFIRDKYERKLYYDQDALTAAPAKTSCDRDATAPAKTSCDRDATAPKRTEPPPESRTSPQKSEQTSVDLLGLDAPDSSSGTGSGAGSGGPISDDLDIFGPMVSNPLPSPGNTRSSQKGSSSQPPPHSSSSTTSTTKEEKKTLSKDSILSLYATSSVARPLLQSSGGQGLGQFATQGFSGGVGGGALPPLAGQGMYTTPQPQAQWNMNQMTQQMSAMTAGGAGGAGGAGAQEPAAPSPLAGWSSPPTSGQTLSTQLWK